MQMSNAEMLENYENLKKFQVLEKEYCNKTGAKLLKGCIAISFAIEQNKQELSNRLQPYEKVMNEQTLDYRDIQAETAAVEAENEAAKKEKRAKKAVGLIFKPEKNKEEYFKKVDELLGLKTDVNIRKVDIKMFDGMDLDSGELGLLFFMITG